MTTQELIDQAQQLLFVAQDRLVRCSEASARYGLSVISDLIREELVGGPPEPAWTPETVEPK